MATVRCSRCGKAFERTPHQVQVCPNCGLRAPLVPPHDPIMPEGVVGKPNRPIVVFLLTLLLQLVFWPLYLLQTFRPLDKQHGRFHPMAWWIGPCVPVLGVFFATTYAWIGLVRLQRSRRARGLKNGIGPFWFIVTAMLVPLGAVGYAGYILVSDNGNDVDLGRVMQGAAYEVFANLEVWQYVVLGAAFLIPPAVALALVTASANKLWRVIYEEKGESWPWRPSVQEPEIPMTP